MKARLFLDTNVMLDLLGERIPFYDSVAQVATLADRQEIELVVSALSFATVNYFLTIYEGAEKALDKLRKFKVICEICDLDEFTIEKGLNSGFSGFEGSLQYYGALKSNCNFLITRNAKDFKKAHIPVMTTEEFLVRYLKDK